MKKHRQEQIDPLRYMPVPLHVEDDEPEAEEEEEFEDGEAVENQDEQ